MITLYLKNLKVNFGRRYSYEAERVNKSKTPTTAPVQKKNPIAKSFAPTPPPTQHLHKHVTHTNAYDHMNANASTQTFRERTCLQTHIIERFGPKSLYPVLTNTHARTQTLARIRLIEFIAYRAACIKPGFPLLRVCVC